MKGGSASNLRVTHLPRDFILEMLPQVNIFYVHQAITIR